MPTSKELLRVTLDLLFPEGVDQFAQFLQLRHNRRTFFHGSTFFGTALTHSDPDAMILELNGPTSLHHYWPLCTQLLVISRSRALVYSDAASETWVEVLDRCLKEDPSTAATALKSKPSRNGGRPVATPSAIVSAISATKQKPKRYNILYDHIADIRVKGEVGREDGEVLRRIISHACSTTGLALSETAPDAVPKVGEFYHLASRDQYAPPGCLRLLLRSADEVRKVHAALHGQTVRVGTDRVAIEILNTPMQLGPLPGNGRR